MNKTLKSFVDYCEKNPQERFYQALTNWSGYNFIYGSMAESRDEHLEDTFYIEDEK
jgi:hypothetical protein